MNFATKPIQHYPPTLGTLLHYRGKLKTQIFCRYSTDMEENANKLHFKCTDFNSSMCVTVYVKCIYVFLSKSCWLLTNTAATSAVINFWCHQLIAKINEQKNSDMKNFVCYQYEEKLAISNNENIKICGWITKMHFVCTFFHTCWISTENLKF